MQNRNRKIDILRGASILFVILLHLNIRIPFKGTFIGEIMPDFLYKFLFWSGYYGVAVFFVISGFLITSSAMERWGNLSAIRPADFYKMRFARIFPLLAALLAVLSVLHATGVSQFTIGPANGASLGNSLLAALTFSINWYEIKVGYLPGAWDVLWTLSIEEVFYVAFPIICILARRERNFLFVMLLLVIVAPLFRSVWMIDNELGDRNNLACMDGIALGCISAIAARRKTFTPGMLRTMQIAGWFLCGAVFLLRRSLYVSGISKYGLNVTLLSVGVSLLLVCWYMQHRNGNYRTSPLFSWLGYYGRNCYEIYLTHMFVVIGAVALFEYAGLDNEWIWILYISTVALSGLAGGLIAGHFTGPANRYLRNMYFCNRHPNP